MAAWAPPASSRSHSGHRPLQDVLDTLVDAGANLWACQMSTDMMKIEPEDLYDGVDGIIGATEFMEMSEGAQIIFI